MPEEAKRRIGERVRALARFITTTDVVRVRVARDDDDIEVAIVPSQAKSRKDRSASQSPAQRVDTIKADLVGIFHVIRPTPAAGDVFDADRELGHIEALGIRTPIHSMGAGRLVAIATSDGEPVEYGQPLFLVARGR